jgi:hypothetical protein
MRARAHRPQGPSAIKLKQAHRVGSMKAGAHMKAPNKYGSSYPLASSRQVKKTRPHHKASDAVDAVDAAHPPSALALPHERDESIDEGGGAVHSETVQQAFKDVQQGLPDTDRGAEVNQTYQQQKI